LNQCDIKFGMSERLNKLEHMYRIAKQDYLSVKHDPSSDRNEHQDNSLRTKYTDSIINTYLDQNMKFFDEIPYDMQVHEPRSISLTRTRADDNTIDPTDNYRDAIVGIFPMKIVDEDFSLTMYESSRVVGGKPNVVFEQAGSKGCTAASNVIILYEKIGSTVLKDMESRCRSRGLSDYESEGLHDLKLARKRIVMLNIKVRNDQLDFKEQKDNVSLFVSLYSPVVMTYGGHAIVVDEINEKYAVVRDPYCVMHLVLDVDKFIRNPANMLNTGYSYNFYAIDTSVDRDFTTDFGHDTFDKNEH
ncbi:hypothetical protein YASMINEVIRUS_797, partial [Yasminevirus sp. GU-2018]